jgi:hydroxypyruvate reductase
MADAALGDRALRVSGGLVISLETGTSSDRLQRMVGSHPIPGPTSVAAGEAALRLAQRVGPEEELLVLISGGASAMMAVPADAITLEEKRSTTAELLKRGADIYALNTVRKHLSRIKGGRLAAAVRGRCRTLIVSDVVGDDMSVIASGPTVTDRSTFANALDVLTRHGGLGTYPHAVVAHLEAGVRGEVPDTPKPGDARIDDGLARVIGGRHDAMLGAADEARARGYQVIVLEPPVVGEARHVGASLIGGWLEQRHAWPRPCCVIASGETVVNVVGRGRGGRNQELALASVDVLAHFEGLAAAASAGTDGIDGPTDAAGAVADSTTLDRGIAAGLLAPRHYLDTNDAYTYFDRLGDLIRTGPTGTNVGDLQVLLIT